MVRTFAKVLLVNGRGEILFLRRSDTDENRPGGWDFPGGNAEPGEDAYETVIRETQEEAGLQLHDPQLIFAATRTGGYGVGCWLLFLAYVPDDVTITLSPEHSSFEWFTPEAALAASGYVPHQELLQFVIDNRVLDAATPKTVTCRALVVNEAGELLLLRRSPTDPLHAGTWDLPGGRAEPDERLAETLARETLEECGLKIDTPALVFATSNPRLAGGGTGTWLFYQTYVPKDTPIHLSFEHDRYQWVPVADFPQYTDYDVLLRMHTFAMAYRLYNAARIRSSNTYPHTT